MIGFKDRNIVLGVVMVAAVAYAATAILRNRQAYDIVEPPGEQAPASPQRPLVSPLVPEQSRALAETDDTSDAALLAQVEHKYRFLTAGVGEDHVDELRRRLLEQHHLAEYTGGIHNVAPLDEKQERIVLDAKLRQKQRYASVMRDAGFERDSLSNEERAFAHARTAEALKQYMEDFLVDVAPALTQEQYTQLKNYEMTEFTRELSRLQQRTNAK